MDGDVILAEDSYVNGVDLSEDVVTTDKEQTIAGTGFWVLFLLTLRKCSSMSFLKIALHPVSYFKAAGSS